MRKLFLITVLLFTSLLQGQTSGKISGVITDQASGDPLPGVNISVVNSTLGASTDVDGFYVILNVPVGAHDLMITYIGYKSVTVKGLRVFVDNTTELSQALSESVNEGDVEEVVSKKVLIRKFETNSRQVFTRENLTNSNGVGTTTTSLGGRKANSGINVRAGRTQETRYIVDGVYHVQYSESYDEINENHFHKTFTDPFSTFSIDVDRASYSNMRRFITNSTLPHKDVIRIEEMINYFDYKYKSPRKELFNVETELTESPWNKANKLVRIGIKGKSFDEDSDMPNNLVFLIDVSGSMQSANKLELVKKSLRLLVKKLKSEDRVSIVVYAGAAGVVLPSTSKKHKMMRAIDKLSAGGSTAGGAGIQLAYKIALKNFVENGNNRVILATDGDFNVGASSDKAMLKLIKKKRDSGIYLSILGYGMGNYKDSKMEQMSNAGNGNYAYIDNILEAKKVLVNEMNSTLHTIAKDVKVQILFNPARVKSYRLIGYENRKLNKEDFDDDKKDAGELGAGHTVTALYEIVPADGIEDELDSRYTQLDVKEKGNFKNELMFARFRYKSPNSDKSELLEIPVIYSEVNFKQSSQDHQFASSVAAFGMLLRDSKYINDFNFDEIVEIAKNSLGKDEFGYRTEFVSLVQKAKALKNLNN